MLFWIVFKILSLIHIISNYTIMFNENFYYLHFRYVISNNINGCSYFHFTHWMYKTLSDLIKCNLHSFIRFKLKSIIFSCNQHFLAVLWIHITITENWGGFSIVEQQEPQLNIISEHKLLHCLITKKKSTLLGGKKGHVN